MRVGFLNKNNDVVNVLSKDPDLQNYNSKGKLRLFSNLITRLAKSLCLHKDNFGRVIISPKLSPNEQYRSRVDIGNYFHWCNWVLYHHTLPQNLQYSTMASFGVHKKWYSVLLDFPMSEYQFNIFHVIYFHNR